MPDDGNRYELLDGLIVVTPAPSWEHQTAVVRLTVLLSAACRDTQQVLVAPFDVQLSPDTVLQPDLLIARVEDFRVRGETGVPELAVEITSPSTQRYDLRMKKDRYARAGVPSYWTLDPVSGHFHAWQLDDADYRLIVEAQAHERVRLDHPVEVEFLPRDLLGEAPRPVRPSS